MYDLEEIVVIWLERARPATHGGGTKDSNIHDRAERHGTRDPADILRAHQIFWGVKYIE